MKKLLLAALAILGLSVKAEAAPIYGYVQITTSTTLTPTLQTGAINISSGSIRNLKVSTESVTTTAISSAVITNESVSVSTITTLTVSTLNGISPSALTGVTAGYGLTGGGTTGNVTLNLNSGTTSYIQNTTTLQSGTTFYVSSGTANNFTTSTATINNTLSLGGEFQPGLASSTSGQILVSQGANRAPKFQWGGRINQIARYSISAATSTTSLVAANTSLTGSFTPLESGSTIQILVTGVFSTASSDQGYLSITRNGSSLCAASGCLRQISPGANALEIGVAIGTTDVPNSVSAQTYTVTMRSNGGGTVQFCETNITCSMIITEFGQ